MILPDGARSGSADVKKPTSNSAHSVNWTRTNGDSSGAPTLVVSDLPIDILGHTAHMREIEDDPLPSAASLHHFPSAAGLSQLRSIHAVEDFLVFDLDFFNIRGRLRVFFQEGGAGVVTCCEERSAGVVREKGVGE